MVYMPTYNSSNSCASGWISFSCSGDFNTKTAASRMLDSANLALVTGKSMMLKLNEAQKHNGYCVANEVRIDR